MPGHQRPESRHGRRPHLMVKRIILLATGHSPFPSYLHRFRLHHSDICACGEKGDPLHYVRHPLSTVHPLHYLLSSFQFTKPSVENTLLW
ncbi:hypothetical protein AVEN_265028-1 [Araneus ventricosus]|uniref:Uncharacterized protein n=1 Tax=Araneus ventricosus TaxID=182803 RepID=A0A4Y2EJW4_ARAVE|nr:hypothetical protein AVEN_265028-1 [Araneus ventricosus]